MDRLTATETKIVRLVGSGYSAKAIASQLGRSRRTVEHHIARIAQKLDLPGRPRERIVAYFHRELQPAR